ncbi:MAG: hypothetical protein JWP63_3142 [Candidatus Solibacter sp.]|nr:hypothetical protein [Candidatus Solibacter sp.]
MLSVAVRAIPEGYGSRQRLRLNRLYRKALDDAAPRPTDAPLCMASPEACYGTPRQTWPCNPPRRRAEWRAAGIPTRPLKAPIRFSRSSSRRLPSILEPRA